MDSMPVTDTVIKYIHPQLNDNIGPEGRSYSLEEELVEYRGRNILCLHSKAGFNRFCDGNSLSHLYTIFVKGFIMPDRYRIPEQGTVISELQPISDGELRQDVEKFLRDRWGTAQIYYF